MKVRSLVGLLPGLMLAGLLLIGCQPAPTPTPAATPSPLPSGRLTFAGSTTLQPLVAKLGETFGKLYPDVQLEIAAGGSVVGIQAIHDGTVDIGMASRALTPDEAQGVNVHQVAVDVIAMVVHPSNPVRDLSLEQLRGIYTGQIVNWRDLGGPDLDIAPVARGENSGTRGAFDHLALDDQEAAAPNLVTVETAGEVAARVAADPAAIGYVGFGNLDAGMTTLTVGGVAPSARTARDGSYPLARPLLLLTGPLSQPLAQRFIDFARSPEGRALIEQAGWTLPQ